MEIEHLSKSQIVLLTLFASFVASIATGIVTFSLMQQAPPTITQTISRIVERTIEKTVPGHTALVAAPVEKTVIVKQTDTIAAAVAAAKPSLVRLYTNDAANPVFLGLGVVLTASGLIAADESEIPEDADAVVELQDGTHARAFVTKRDETSGIIFLSATTSAAEQAPTWKPIDVTASQIALGQSVVVLAGKSAVRLGAGIITNVHVPDTTGGISIAETNITESAIMPGSPLIDENGTLVGISTALSRQTTPGAFVSLYTLFPKDTSPKVGK